MTSLAGEDDVRRGQEVGVTEYHIKLDRELVSHVDSDGARHAFIEALVRLSLRIGSRLIAEGIEAWERTDFVQIRVRLDDMVCAWLQIAPCDPPPDEKRDHGLIAQYLDPHTFLWWLRSLLADSNVEGAGSDWDANHNQSQEISSNGSHALDSGSMPTVEEILRSWARDAAAFRTADQKVKTYLSELERRAAETKAPADAELLRTFRKTWETLSGELQ